MSCISMTYSIVFMYVFIISDVHIFCEGSALSLWFFYFMNIEETVFIVNLDLETDSGPRRIIFITTLKFKLHGRNGP